MSDKHNSNFNKFAMGFLFAGVLAMISGFIADIFYNPVEPEKRGFSVAVAEENSAEGATEVAVAIDIPALMAAADAARGESEFKKRCASCHSIENGGADKTGPNLWGVYGVKFAHKAGYPYSSALTSHGGNFDEKTLFEWLENPQAVAKGSKMVLKIKKPETRADIIKYLETMK